MKCKIKIAECNSEKIDSIIKQAEGRASARTITASDVISAIEIIEKRLRIPKGKMVGITADVDCNAQTFPGAYKYTPESTQFTAERTKSGWYLTSVERCRTRGCTQTYVLTLTEEAKQAIIEANSIFC